MSRIRWLKPLIVIIAFWVVCGFSVVSAGQIVVVQLRNGRLLTGEVDTRTDDVDLWLHSTEPSIVVLSSVPWSEVRAARVGGQGLPNAQLRQSLSQLKTPIPVAIFRQPAAPLAPPLPPPPRVTSLEMRATLANWDRDVEPDGLEVRVNPADAQGNLAAVDGMLTIRLLGRRLGTAERLESPSGFGFQTDGGNSREYSPRLNNSRYVELGRWSERLKSKDATGMGYLLRLPFRGVNPEFDLDVALDGHVDVQLNVIGQQIHSATIPIQLRVYSPLREELQLHRGTRFFADELTGR